MHTFALNQKCMKVIVTSLVAFVLGIIIVMAGSNNNGPKEQYHAGAPQTASTVYFTKEITSESLVRIFNALGVEAKGKVAVKISTGEAGGHNYLKPELIGELVKTLNGTIVECNTAYPGKRMSTKAHMEVIKDHGFTAIAPVDIMDADGDIKIPVKDKKWIEYDRVGSHVEDYDFMVDLAHFKGHAMGGFGGVLKNASIGVASVKGKAYIHSAGKTNNRWLMWLKLPKGWTKAPENNDPFIESMASAAQAVHDYYSAKQGIVYINIMNNMSIDCDCDSHPAEPLVKDRGIMASLDPVAVDKACLDLVFGITPTEGDDNGPLTERIKQRHGTHIVEYGESIGLGSMSYNLVEID